MIDDSRFDQSAERQERDYSSFQTPVSGLLFIIWSAVCFFGNRDIPGFDGLTETLLACLVAYFLSLQKSSAFRYEGCVLPIILLVAWLVGSIFGFSFKPSLTEQQDREELKGLITVQKLRLGLSRAESLEQLPDLVFSNKPVEVHGDLRLEFQNERLVAVRGPRVEVDGRPIVNVGDERGVVFEKFDPRMPPHRSRLQFYQGDSVLRFQTSQGKVSEIVLYDSTVSNIILKPKDLLP